MERDSYAIDRIVLLVIDGLGLGAMPDVPVTRPKDVGADTLRHVVGAAGGLSLPNLERLGLGTVAPSSGLRIERSPIGAHGICALGYQGADTFLGHQVMMGSRVPDAPPFVDGVVFSRGQVVPAINMRARFGFERAPLDVSTRLLVVQSRGRSVGLLVDACREFLTLPAASIHPPADALSGLGTQYVEGVATAGERLIVVLGLERLLGTTEHAVPA